MYTVTRQKQYPEETPVVEVSSGGIDYTNPDALAEKYPGEFCEYKDPREAVKDAIEICRLWRKDGEKRAKVGVGFTHGMTMSFEPISFKEARKWAEEEYKKLPKCAECGAIIQQHRERYTAGVVVGGEFIPDEEYIYCSEFCAEKNTVYEEDEDDM